MRRRSTLKWVKSRRLPRRHCDRKIPRGSWGNLASFYWLLHAVNRCFGWVKNSSVRFMCVGKIKPGNATVCTAATVKTQGRNELVTSIYITRSLGGLGLQTLLLTLFFRHFLLWLFMRSLHIRMVSQWSWINAIMQLRNHTCIIPREVSPVPLSCGPGSPGRRYGKCTLMSQVVVKGRANLVLLVTPEGEWEKFTQPHLSARSPDIAKEVVTTFGFCNSVGTTQKSLHCNNTWGRRVHIGFSDRV